MRGKRGLAYGGLVGLIVLLGVFVALRLDLRTRITNGDEDIPIKLSQAMSAAGRLDPNWAFADLPGPLRYPQYNFYTYNVASHGVLRAAQALSVHPLVALRLVNLVYQAIALVALLAMLRNIGASAAILWLAAGLLVITPAMVHDAHMARPESFLYMLFGLAAWAATWRVGVGARAAAVGFIVGVGAACKITFLATGLLFTPFLLSLSRQTFTLAAIGALAATFGFAVSAPYVLIHPDVFLNGVKTLFEQYAAGHPPHSLVERSVLGSIAWTAEFLVKLYGPLVPAALILPLIWTRTPIVVGL
jgi:hypothetical protein